MGIDRAGLSSLLAKEMKRTNLDGVMLRHFSSGRADRLAKPNLRLSRVTSLLEINGTDKKY